VLPTLVSFGTRDDQDLVTWTCPRCDASQEMTFSRDRPVYAFDVATKSLPEDQGLLDFMCDCGHKHDGGGDKTGCGFAARMPVKAT
jgi:hypothetical protein